MEELEERTLSISCDSCLSCHFSEGGDGFFYCDCCGSQAPDAMDTGIADEHFVEKLSDARAGMYLPSNSPQRPEDVSDEKTCPSTSLYREFEPPEEEEDDHDDTSAYSNTPTGDDELVPTD